MIVVGIGIFISMGLFLYFNNRQERRNNERRERLQDKQQALMDLLTHSTDTDNKENTTN